MATIKAPEQSRILPIAEQVKPQSEGFDAVPCVGPACALFSPVYSEGKVVGGECSFTLLPTALAMVNASVREAAALNSKEKN